MRRPSLLSSSDAIVEHAAGFRTPWRTVERAAEGALEVGSRIQVNAAVSSNGRFPVARERGSRQCLPSSVARSVSVAGRCRPYSSGNSRVNRRGSAACTRHGLHCRPRPRPARLATQVPLYMALHRCSACRRRSCPSPRSSGRSRCRDRRNLLRHRSRPHSSPVRRPRHRKWMCCVGRCFMRKLGRHLVVTVSIGVVDIACRPWSWISAAASVVGGDAGRIGLLAGAHSRNLYVAAWW